jgi:hypothetical protein
MVLQALSEPVTSLSHDVMDGYRQISVDLYRLMCTDRSAWTVAVVATHNIISSYCRFVSVFVTVATNRIWQRKIDVRVARPITWVIGNPRFGFSGSRKKSKRKFCTNVLSSL